MSRYNAPLRYPGGKQKLTPFILEIMAENELVGGHYAEPYAGGAGVAVELLLSGKVSHVHLNDSCDAIYAFWRSILSKPEEFCRRISSASLTVKEWRRQKEILSRPSEFDQVDLGFSTFYLNRCNRSGILSGGLIGGLKQTGNWKMDARFSRNELIRRVEAIALRKKSITVKNLDAEKFILEHISKLPEKSLVYCDPPYFHKAQRLYLNHYNPADHLHIAQVIQKIARPWIVSYDNAPEILECYSERRSFLYSLQYNAAKAYKGTEAFFFSDDLKLPTASSISSINAALKVCP
jgi:DNA adenine methylase